MPGDDIEFRVQALEKDSERNSNQHREFYAKFGDLEKKNAVTEERYSTILTTLAEMKTAVEELKAKPARRWDSVVEKAILVIVTAIISYMLARTGLG